MKKNYLVAFVFMGIALAFCSCSEKDPESPIAEFTIEKDSIINDAKVRVEVDKVRQGETVYFVPKGTAMFNTVWPGDSLRVGSNITYRDYDTRKQLVTLGPRTGRDTTTVIKSPAPYQGLFVEGEEKAHIFTSKGNLTVTWIATNCNSDDCVSAIKQKKILVE